MPLSPAPKPPAPIELLKEPPGLISGGVNPPPIPFGQGTGLVVTVGSSTYDVIVDPTLPAGDWVFVSHAVSTLSSGKLPAVDALNSGPEGSAAQGVLGVSQHSEGVRGVGLGEGAGVAGINNAPLATAQPGVWGESQNGEGVHGLSHAAGAGVWGQSSQFDGVHGVSLSNQPPPQDRSHSPGAGLAGINGNGGLGLWVQGGSTSPDGKTQIPAAYFGIFQGGTLAALFEGDINVTGNINVLSGGDVILADCSEQFDVAEGEEIAPGTVVIIAEDGVLAPSYLPYDKRVAGIVSGAGDYRSAITLDRRPSPQWRASIALVGKVYCKVDATYGSVEIGDLLTTSPTPGHAMRALDPLKAFGAVIGKALGRLKTGLGLVPILVALQ